MTWRLIGSRPPPAAEPMPEQGVQPLACHLNSVVSVMAFESDRGATRDVDFTYAMQRRAADLEMTPEDYVAGLLRFADKAVA